MPIPPILALGDTPGSSHASSSSTYTTPHSRNSSVDLPPHLLVHHRPPELPSTILPSYFPEPRDDSLHPDLRLSRVPSSAERTSLSGHLLDGVPLDALPRQPKYELGVMDLEPGLMSRSLPFPSASRPWESSKRSWAEMSIFDEVKSVSAGGSDIKPRLSEFSDSGRPPNQQPRTSLSGPSIQSQGSSSYNPSRRNTLTDPVPNSFAYPQMLYDGSVKLPESSEGWAPTPDSQVTGDDYAQALALYEHVLSGLPHILPANTAGASTGRRFDSLVSVAEHGAQIISGQYLQSPEPRVAAPLKVTSGRKAGVEKKTTTQCLGCGTTETPEWRRGPMGPRTLCNACVS